jgi:lambda family phage portal protein
MISGLRERVAQWIAPKATTATPLPAQTTGKARAIRQYGAARITKTTGSFGSSDSSADAELQSSLTVMRNRSRQMVRDSGYAKRAKATLVNNIVGTGVGLQAQVMGTRGELNQRVNDDIERAHREWSRASSCHTGAKLHFSDMERALCGEVVEAGEILVRLHLRAFGDSKVPFALEVIEAERIASDIVMPGAMNSGNEVRLGVEVDRFQRPVAYFLRPRHGGDIRFGNGGNETVERVPADQILHLHLTARWPQTRGEPWFHTAVRKMDDINEYSQHEISAARASAAYFATITTPEEQNPLQDEEGEDGQGTMNIEPLTIQELRPGEDLKFHTPNRPNSSFDGFMRAMLREVAAGVGTSYESLSRDYSQSNYSSSRLALLDDRDGYRALQQWWVRSFRDPLYRIWLRQAVLSRAIPSIPVEAYAIDTARYEAVRWKLRGWGWVDPTKEVNAYKEAVKAGFTTVTDVIAQTAGGMDIEDVIATRQRELQMLEEAEIEVDTTVHDPMAILAAEAAAKPAPTAPRETDDGDEVDDEGSKPARVFALRNTA